MKILLMTLNAKFIHSNLAIHSMYHYVKDHGTRSDAVLILKEFTINHNLDDVLVHLERGCYDAVFVSCYIWNIEQTLTLLENYHLLHPETAIFLGGPEPGYAPSFYLREYAFVDGILMGEGERVFQRIYEALPHAVDTTGKAKTIACLKNIDGLAYRGPDGAIQINAMMAPINPLDEIPFPYDDFKAFENRILYYESTRGCPYQCSYCLSSACGAVRFRSLTSVYKDLAIFLKANVPQVKFIDRTFNVNKKHALGILNYIRENDNGITNFHFEITAELLDEDYFECIEKMREGLVQFEVGIQTTNPETLKAIRRNMNQEKLLKNVKALIALQKAHIHVDLIAGLPYETETSFYESFDTVYNLRAHQLQLGFLKVLKGTHIATQLEMFGYKVRRQAPFEVLSNQWMSFETMCRLKEIEMLVERYHNSGRFNTTMTYLTKWFGISPHQFYLKLADDFRRKGLFDQPLGMTASYDALYAFAIENKAPCALIADLLKFDYNSANMKGRRPFFDEPNLPRFNAKRLAYLHHNEAIAGINPKYRALSGKEILKTVNIVAFKYDIIALINTNYTKVLEQLSLVLFDYAVPTGSVVHSKVHAVNEILECE
ncbi:DUF4080 domain-containing protein [Fusibacter paucivorans]|uniref:DUF4080 domain-containing protein n=1 Tax=Fusibacter paucivorans TaxID=76009 RepID=A0ABS5PL39_9FIRM|nr:B12-binding domain-containing radical SAM protein [Fusibacter paucivorans]MBS7525627.1 DUF4080 domain-containing protein [Fusibacter paucivorans]